MVTGALVVSMALAVTPEGNVKKVAQLISGVVMAVLLLSPLVGKKPELKLEEPAVESFENKVGNELMKEIIERRTRAYILNKAQALGLSVDARVSCSMDGLYPLPAYVEIICDEPERARGLLEPVIEADLGITPSRQMYMDGGA